MFVLFMLNTYVALSNMYHLLSKIEIYPELRSAYYSLQQELLSFSFLQALVAKKIAYCNQDITSQDSEVE